MSSCNLLVIPEENKIIHPVAETEELIDHLKEKNILNYALALENSINGASTGSELLFSVRFTLKAIIDDEIIVEKFPKERLEGIISNINLLLSKGGQVK